MPHSTTSPGFRNSSAAFGLPTATPPGRAGREHVAGLDRDVAREVLEDVGQLPDLVARVDAHAQLAVDRARHPEVVGIGDLVERDQLGAERAEAGDVLAGPEARARVTSRSCESRSVRSLRIVTPAT